MPPDPCKLSCLPSHLLDLIVAEASSHTTRLCSLIACTWQTIGQNEINLSLCLRAECHVNGQGRYLFAHAYQAVGCPSVIMSCCHAYWEVQ